MNESTKPRRPAVRPNREALRRREELILAEPIPATERLPEDWIYEFQDLGRFEPGMEQFLIPRGELLRNETQGREGFCPPWLAQTTLPRMAPRLRSRAVLAALSNRMVPMSVLSHPDTELFDRSWPYSTIGRVFCGTATTVNETNWMNLWTNSGTGTMIGPNLMVTASHIAPWGQGPGQWWMRFVPSYWGALVGGGFTQPFGGSFVEQFTGVQIDDDVTGRDVVVCKLYRRLGDVTGWMGAWRWFDEDEYRNWPYTSVGYPGNPYQGQRPVIQPFAAIDDVDSDGDGLELETHPFTSDGWSGGPLYFWRNGSALVAGVCAGQEEEFDFWEVFTKTHSVFSGGQRLTDLFEFAWANWV
jgi:hypothetical protein